MLNTREIIGFPEPSAERHFELISKLRRQRQAEIARITEMATRLSGRFGAETAVGFLYYEILGRAPDHKDLLGYAERLYRTPSVVPLVVEQLIALAQSQH